MEKEEDKRKFTITTTDDGIIHLSLGGRLEGLNLVALEKWTHEVHNLIKDRYENTYTAVKVIIDIEGVTGYAPEAVTILTNLLIEDKEMVHRSATYGGSDYILMAQDMLASLSGRTNFKSFKSEAEAAIWVNAAAGGEA